MKTAIVRVLAALSVSWMQIALAQQPSTAVAQLMKAVVIPASDAVFAVGKAVPKSDGEWGAVESGAARLIDAGKTLEKLAPAGDAANWARFSHAMSDAAVTAVKAAKSKNADAVLDAGDVLYMTCEDCHKQYLRK